MSLLLKEAVGQEETRTDRWRNHAMKVMKRQVRSAVGAETLGVRAAFRGGSPQKLRGEWLFKFISLEFIRWSTVALKCWATFYCTVKWISQTCTYSPSFYGFPFHFRSPQSTEYIYNRFLLVIYVIRQEWLLTKVSKDRLGSVIGTMCKVDNICANCKWRTMLG